ncbi:MAG: HEAT repeat domain-containing protein [Gemmatimonadetes bacterium]|nr:HEAT repeat domain-containing protein [Gemmatimonadota bacterium]
MTPTGEPREGASGEVGAAPAASRSNDQSRVAPVAFDDWSDDAPIAPAQLAELFQALDKAARARRLYQVNNPVYQSFHEHLRASLSALWDRLPSLSIAIEEEAFRVFGHAFPSRDGRDGLPFLFFRDGVRLMTLLPGFEDEVDRFLGVVDRARQFGPAAGDDIVTVLWEEEFSSFQYSYVDLLAESTAAPGLHDEARVPLERVDRERVERIASGDELQPQPPAVEAGEPPVATAVLPDRFIETAYFLEPEDVELLQREVDIEWNRDVRKAVLDALFDRLEDPEYLDRRSEVLRILAQLLPAYLGRGDLDNATIILIEVNGLLRANALDGDDMSEALRLLRDVNDPGVLGGFFGSLEEGTIDPTHEQLGDFLGFLGSEALPLMLRTTARPGATRLADRMWPALDSIGRKNPRAIVQLLGSPESLVAAAAARLAGRIGLPEARDGLIRLYEQGDANTRRIAVESLAVLADNLSLATVQHALNDQDREIRIGAARALGNAGSRAACERLREIVTGRSIRNADLTEMIAFFEAFGSVAEDKDIAVLDAMLNGRRLLGGRESHEIRACAAMALGRIAAPAARAALRRAQSETNPIVKNAVTRALEPERRGR